MITQEQWIELDGYVRTAARRVATQWPDVVEFEDLTQDMLLHLYESGEKVLDRIFEEDDRTRQAFLIKVGHQKASLQQIDYDRFTGNYLYNSNEVRALLEARALTDADETIFHADKMDLIEAMENLKDTSYHAAIVNRYVHDLVPERRTAEAKRLERAVDALTNRMNWIGADRRKARVEGPGTRTAHPAKAGLVSATVDWQGDYADGRR